VQLIANVAMGGEVDRRQGWASQVHGQAREHAFAVLSEACRSACLLTREAGRLDGWTVGSTGWRHMFLLDASPGSRERVAEHKGAWCVHCSCRAGVGQRTAACASAASVPRVPAATWELAGPRRTNKHQTTLLLVDP
jgi:hypothetical protein